MDYFKFKIKKIFPFDKTAEEIDGSMGLSLRGQHN